MFTETPRWNDNNWSNNHQQTKHQPQSNSSNPFINDQLKTTTPWSATVPQIGIGSGSNISNNLDQANDAKTADEQKTLDAAQRKTLPAWIR